MPLNLRLSIFLNLLFCWSHPVQAQDQQDYTWLLGLNSYLPELYFGGDIIDFNEGSPTVTYFEMPIDLWVPCVASNPNGVLQFYTDGCRIMNHQHEPMENGDHLNPGIIRDAYCTEQGSGYPAINSLLALPFPGHEGQYYLFHMQQEAWDHQVVNLLWSKVDMNANGGLGKVLEKNVNIWQDTLLLSLRATRHANGRDWWIVVGEQANDDTYCFLFDTTGVHPIPNIRRASWIGPHQGPNVLAFSPDGKKMARGSHGNPASFRIYDFDRCSGQISNPVTLQIPEEEAYVSWPCFSPNSRYLYLTNQVSRVYQYDTWAADINASVQLVGEYDGFIAEYNSPTRLYTMTNGPDQRIYMSSTNGTRYLHVIHQPDGPGLACDFRQHDFQMPATSLFFLPNMPHYRLYNEPSSPCDTLGVKPPLVAQWRSERNTVEGLLAMVFTDISYFQPNTWHWTFGDGTSSTLPSPTHVFPAAGEYEVCLEVCNDAGLCDTLCRTVAVSGTTTSLPTLAEAAQVAVWPNPANSHLWVAHPNSGDKEFRMFDLDGRLVLQQSLSDNSSIGEMSVGHLPKGLYFWQLFQAGQAVKSGKVIVQR